MNLRTFLLATGASIGVTGSMAAFAERDAAACGGSDSGGSVFGCNAGAASSPLTWMGALFAGALVISVTRRRR